MMFGIINFLNLKNSIITVLFIIAFAFCLGLMSFAALAINPMALLES